MVVVPDQNGQLQQDLAAGGVVQYGCLASMHVKQCVCMRLIINGPHHIPAAPAPMNALASLKVGHIRQELAGLNIKNLQHLRLALHCHMMPTGAGTE